MTRRKRPDPAAVKRVRISASERAIEDRIAKRMAGLVPQLVKLGFENFRSSLLVDRAGKADEDHGGVTSRATAAIDGPAMPAQAYGMAAEQPFPAFVRDAQQRLEEEFTRLNLRTYAEVSRWPSTPADSPVSHARISSLVAAARLVREAFTALDDERQTL